MLSYSGVNERSKVQTEAQASTPLVAASAPRTPTFKDAGQAFSDAINAGRLTDVGHQGICPDVQACRYAACYMYMGTWDGRDTFKHILTRRYIP